MRAKRLGPSLIVVLLLPGTALAPGPAPSYEFEGSGWLVLKIESSGSISAVLDAVVNEKIGYQAIYLLDAEGTYIRGSGFLGRNHPFMASIEASSGETAFSHYFGGKVDTVPVRNGATLTAPPPVLHLLAWAVGVESWTVAVTGSDFTVLGQSQGSRHWVVMESELSGSTSADVATAEAAVHFVQDGRFTFNSQDQLVGVVRPGGTKMPMSLADRAFEGPSGRWTCPCAFRNLGDAGLAPGEYALFQNGTSIEPAEAGVAFVGIDAHLPP